LHYNSPKSSQVATSFVCRIPSRDHQGAGRCRGEHDFGCGYAAVWGRLSTCGGLATRPEDWAVSPAFGAVEGLFSILLGLCGHRLPELNLIPIQVIDPGKATVGFIHSFGVNLYSLVF
jgi:hypothetical protein